MILHNDVKGMKFGEMSLQADAESLDCEVDLTEMFYELRLSEVGELGVEFC